MAGGLTRRRVAAGLVGLVGLVVLGVLGAAADEARVGASAGPSAGAGTAGVLLRQAANGDGDSWKDTGGAEYRMGLVNAPEVGECGGSQATAYRRAALAGGFRADSYQVDRYGRAVSVIVTAKGVNLNVDMARQGLADDRYLARYRSENPGLAEQLDTAFAEAKAAKRGVWGSCNGP